MNDRLILVLGLAIMTAICALLAYGLACFIWLQPDPSSWTVEGRASFVFMVGFMLVIWLFVRRDLRNNEQ
jgi:hypothetical protein